MLVDEYNIAGIYEVDFNLAWEPFPEITSEVYFYRLNTGDYFQIKISSSSVDPYKNWDGGQVLLR